ncbi:ATP-binding cassette domain-containing protein [Paenibacillus humicus]|uniref:ATP-binding cassette domain-containing protein n=1 Tax=Paenibacillus humicus TaxID=412861 RepID=UPI003F1751B5
MMSRASEEMAVPAEAGKREPERVHREQTAGLLREGDGRSETLQGAEGRTLLSVADLVVYPEAPEQREPLLQGITMKIRQGEWVHIVGANGSGKSTLLRTLAGLGRNPQAEQSITRMLPSPFDARPLPVVLQQPDAAITGSTPWEDLVMALEYAGMNGADIIPRAEEALAELGLSALMHAPVSTLSGGQKQLLAAAGALAAGSPAMLFDEAASMLDNDSARLLMKHARAMQRRGIAIVWVTQNMDELEAGDRVFALKDGRMVWEGSSERFFSPLASGEPPCRLAGLEAPFAARTAMELNALGFGMGVMPLNAEELAERWSTHGTASHAFRAAPPAVSPEIFSSLEQLKPRSVPRDLILSEAVPRIAGADGSRSFSACFRGGRLTLLVGGNGSGKSTLLETSGGVRPLASGVVQLGEEPLWSGRRPNRDVLLSLGIALQQAETQWFAKSVVEELHYSAKPYRLAGEERSSRIREAMEAAGLDMELLERDPWTLSGGQQRRLALACIVAGRPEWLLLDEPSAGLDAEGTERLCSILQAHRAAGGGAVVAAHSLDALLPIADEVAIMDGGVVCEVMEASRYARSIAREAGAPQALQAAACFGLLEADAVPWLSPSELAGRLASDNPAVAPGRASERKRESRQGTDLSGTREDQAGDQAAGCIADREEAGKKARTEIWKADQERKGKDIGKWIDPRALIASYLMVAAGVLSQKSWLGIGVSLAIALAILVPLRSSLRIYAGAVKGYGVFVLTLAAVAGIGLAPLQFQWEPAADMLLRMLRLMLVMLLGLPLLALLPPFRLQKAADQLLAPLAKAGLPAARITLPISLLFRFIPMLAEEWQRYALIGAARGKFASRPGRVPPSMLYQAAVPYMLSVLRLGDRAADALEAKGFGAGDGIKRSAFKLRLSMRDALALAAGAVLWGGLRFIARI